MSANTHTSSASGRRHTLRRLLRIAGWSLLSLVVFIILAVSAVTIYLSNGRLTEIVNRRASEYFDADVHTRACRFTLWSTFPRFCLEVDTLDIVSRTLRRSHVTAAQRATLPPDADSLASLRHMSGGVNVLALLSGRIQLHNVHADGLHINLVALNDSVNNFSIIPDTDSVPFRIPFISADSITLTDVRDLTFFSAPNALRARAKVGAASLKRIGKSNDYALRLRGDISARLDSITLCSELPFRFIGDVRFAFNPLEVSFCNMRVNLANIDSRISMGMKLGDNSGIDDFRTEVSAFDLMKLLAYLPSRLLPYLSGLQTDLRTCLSIRLTEPYRFSDAGLPSFVAELTIPESSLTYTLNSGQQYTVDGITMHARLIFNGRNWQESSCSIDDLRAHGEGLTLMLSGNIADVFTDPRLAADAHITLDAPRLAAAIPSLAALQPQGSATADLSVNFPVSLLTNAQYTAIPFTADARIVNAAVTLPDGTRIAATDARIRCANTTGHPDASLAITDVRANVPGMLSASIPNLTARALSLPDSRYAIVSDIPSIHADAKNVSLDAAGILSATMLDLQAPGSPSPLSASARHLAATASGVRIAANGLKADLGKSTITLDDCSALFPGGKRIDAGTLAAHLPTRSLTAAALSYTMPDFGDSTRLFRANARRVSLAIPKNDLSLSVGAIDLNTDLYAVPVSITDLLAEVHDPASLIGAKTFRLPPSEVSFRIRSQETAFALAASGTSEVRDGRTFYTAHADIDFDTLHFNQIAHNIEAGPLYHGNRPGVDPHDSTATPRTYSPFIVPDNFDLSANLRAKATVYTNLWLTDLGADLSMHPGRLAIDTVYLSANFGQARLSAQYLSPDAEHITLDAGAHVDRFDLTRFFQSYPNVLAMMPQMANLHGLFHANAYLHTQVFPDMDINTSSTLADISASATDLYLHQTPFIHRIARMALIFEEGDIHIPTIHARARVYDHLLTVEPFDIRIGKYHVNVAGRNDFDGDLYYHIGILHNPLLPIPFGIDIRGKYHHPLIRFARARYNTRLSEQIDGVDAVDHINLVDELHHYGLLLLHHAGTYPSSR